ncbi:unnamed protein product [Schistosoma turkestanicum]|nr:unnamed protein product [Schistosoma turkestanicum]
MLPYHRLDQIYVMLSSDTNNLCSTPQSTTTSTNNPVYVVFSADCGTSRQQLRCDYLTWGIDLTAHVRNAQFRYAQANMRVNRLNEFTSSTSPSTSSSPSTGCCLLNNGNHQQQSTTTTTTTTTSSNVRYHVPHFQNHPVALAYSPIYHRKL